MQRAKGFRGGQGRYKTAMERGRRADAFAYVGRKLRKRDFRSLWITRLTAAAKAVGLRYSTLIHGLKLAAIELNRKMLSELAIADPEAFRAVVAKVKAVLPAAAKTA
jgi:large subunit ribosomal protein L20